MSGVPTSSVYQVTIHCFICLLGRPFQEIQQLGTLANTPNIAVVGILLKFKNRDIEMSPPTSNIPSETTSLGLFKD